MPATGPPPRAAIASRTATGRGTDRRDRLRHHLHHHHLPGHQRSGPPVALRGGGARRPGGGDAAGLPRRRGLPDRVVHPAAAALPEPDGGAPVEHGQPHRGGHRPLRRRWAPPWRGSSSAPTCPAARMWAVLVVVPLGIPDFVVSFGWRGDLPRLRRLLGRRAGDDPGRLPARLPPGGGQHAQRRHRPRGGGAQPRSRTPLDVLEGDGRPGAAGHPGRFGAGRSGVPGRVRRVRDPRLPHADHRGLHRVHGRFRHGGGLRVLAHPRLPRRHPPDGGGRGPGQGPRQPRRLGRGTGPAAAAARAWHRARARRRGGARGAGARGAGRRHRLAPRRGGHLDRAERVDLGRHADHLRVCGRRRPRCHPRRAARRRCSPCAFEVGPSWRSSAPPC